MSQRLRIALVVALTAMVLSTVASDAVRAAPTPRAPVSWYATGDSYSSGEGVPGNAGACAQTRNAWGPLAATRLGDTGWSVPRPVFTACTGHLLEDQYIARSDTGKGSLWDWAVEQGAPRTQTLDVVSLSFGGNNIDFAHVITDCMTGLAGDWKKESILFDDCDVTETELMARIEAMTKPGALTFDTTAWDARENLSGPLSDFYVLMARRHLSPRGRLVVMGYPRLFAPSGEWGTWEGTRCNGVTRGDANMLGRAAEYLDTVIHGQVTKANKELGVEEKILYVSALDLFGGREGARASNAGRHELCGPGEDWLNGATAPANHLSEEGSEWRYARLESGFHPHEKGHSAEANAVVDLLADKGLLIDTSHLVGPVTASELENLSLPPGVCNVLDLPSGDHRLSEGRYAINPGQLTEQYIGIGDVAVGDIDGDHVDDGAFSLGCFNGVADHIDSVYGLLAKDRSLIRIGLTEADPDLDVWDPRREVLIDVEDLSIDAEQVRVTMSWAFQTDASAGPTSIAFGEYQIRGAEFVRTDIRVTSDLTRTEALVAALNARNETDVEALMVPEDANYFDYLMGRGVYWLSALEWGA